MNSDRIPVNDLRDAFKDLDVSLEPEEHQMLEKTLDVDGMYNCCISKFS